MSQEKNNHIPYIIESSILMSETNTPIEVHKGEYSLKNNTAEIKVEGKIYFGWFPRPGLYFSGEVIAESSMNDLPYNIERECIGKEYELFVEDLVFGKGLILNTNTNTKFGSNTIKNTIIKGKFLQQAVYGDKTIPVKKIVFSIPNFRRYLGSLVKYRGDNSTGSSMNRLMLENGDYIISIDKCLDFDAKLKSLNQDGGYIITHNGELKIKKGSLRLDETHDLFHCLNTFITFLNGRRTAVVFLQGVYEDDIVWTDYSNKIIDPYKNVQSWLQKFSTDGVNELWQSFSSLWKDSKDFLIFVIHWYVEANNYSGFTEGSIILTQTALELLYNWWIIEQKKLIVGKDSEKLSASNKIRLLLSQLNISHEAPVKFTQLQEFIKSNDNIIDAPDAIVQIRNAIVHSQEEKRKKLSAINPSAKHEALDLSIWYIELAILRILNYENKYINRCSEINNNVEFVPWINNND